MILDALHLLGFLFAILIVFMLSSVFLGLCFGDDETDFQRRSRACNERRGDRIAAWVALHAKGFQIDEYDPKAAAPPDASERVLVVRNYDRAGAAARADMSARGEAYARVLYTL